MSASPRAALLPTALSLLVLAACGKKDAAPTDTASAATTSAASPAPSNAKAEAELKDVASYELTMDKIDRYFAVQRNLATKMKAMSPAERQAAMARSNDGGDSGNQGDIDGMARAIERVPQYSAAVREAGLSPREYAVMTLALMQSGMAAGVQKMRPKDDADSLARAMKANPANVRFFREHEAEITRKTNEMKAQMEAAGMTGGQ